MSYSWALDVARLPAPDQLVLFEIVTRARSTIPIMKNDMRASVLFLMLPEICSINP
jgi:hypothetical protein